MDEAEEVQDHLLTDFAVAHLESDRHNMSTSKSPQAQREWMLQSPSHDGFGSRGFTSLKRLRFGIEVVQCVSNRRLYVRKLLNRTVDSGSEDSQSEEEEDNYRFKYDLPPELRVSTCPEATVKLPDETYFPNLVGCQQLTVTNWTIFTEYYNGGDLKSFIQEHFDYFDEASAQATRRNVPGHFIWHVAEQIGEALVYMHLGLPYGASGPDNCTRVKGWVPVYHRNICDSNIFLHYPTTADSELDKLKAQAFPRIVLGGWGESAIEGDGPEWIQRGTPPASTISPGLAEWTDVHQFGCVLRLLCMAHVDLDLDSPYKYKEGDDEDDEALEHDLDVDVDGEIWERDRPDSQTLENCNEYGEERVYSRELMKLLQNFERPNMDDPVVEQVQHVPTVAWIASTLLPLARKRLYHLRNPARPTVDYFGSLDVSWTKPSDPIP